MCLVQMTSLKHAAGTFIIKDLHHWLQSVTLSLPDANAKYHFQPAAWTSQAVNFLNPFIHISCRHFLCAQKSIQLLRLLAITVFQVRHHVKLPQLCFVCAYASNHVREHQSPLSYYISMALVISSPASQVTFYPSCIIILLLFENMTTSKIPHTLFCLSEL